jgi:hypothetical protein
VITQVNIKLAQNASGGTAAIQITDLDHLEIILNMSEIDVNRLKEGQAVEITLDAVPDADLQGSVMQIAPAGVLSQGIVNYPVTVALTPPFEGVKTGMSASLNIILEQLNDVLMVPNRAVRTQGREYFATVMNEGQPVQVPVQIGLSNDTMTEIVSGLKEGDAVVLD